MTYKWVGSMLIIAGCGGFGFSMAAGHRRREMLLRELIQVLQFMENELQYQLTPLPELCRQASRETNGILKNVFSELARELNWQTSPDVGSCMAAAIKRTPDLPENMKRHLFRLGQTLGRFDLPGQIQGLQAVKAGCMENIRRMENNRDNRMRSYRTIGICAGVALAVLLA